MRRQYWAIARTCILLLVLAVGLTACKGQRAKVALQKTQQLIAQLEDLNAAKHDPNGLESIKSTVNQANQALAGGEAGQALELAKGARNQAEQLIATVEAAQARDLWNKAEGDIAVAETNSLNRLDTERYNRILQLRTEANDARSKNEWRRVINLSTEISQEVETGISPIKTTADSERIRAETKLQELKSEGGPIYDPESVIDTQNTINRAVERMDEDRDYVIAQSLFRDAVRLAEQGIENVQQAKGKEAIDEIEDLLAEALEEGARDFMPERYDEVISLLEKVITDFRDRQYSRVLDAADDLKPRAENLKIETKRMASEDRIRRMKNHIDILVEAGAREYLPGRIEQLDEVLNQSIQIRESVGQVTLEDEPAFDRIRDLFQQFEDRVAQVDREFSTLAQDAIGLAQNELQTTRAVFLQVQGMFQTPPQELPAGMEPFEYAREGRQAQFQQALDNANFELEKARQRILTRQYRQAIQIAQRQSQEANILLGEIYRLVATNAVIELSNLISRYERDGARIYAPDALERSVADLQRVKDTINEGNYLQATEIAGAARSNVEIMARQISGRAVEDIREARNVLDEVTSEKTEKYSSEALTRVRNLIDQAEQELQAERLKLAVERANEAIQLAREAQSQANQNAAEDAIDEAVKKIERAAAAGAATYAGRELDSARKLIEQAESLYEADSYERAEELALNASERADHSFYKKVNDAEAAIADAKAVGGWEYNNSSLSRASALAREARQALEAGNYSSADSLAESARSLATDVAQDTKKHNFNEAVARITANLEEGRQQGVNYFQVQDSIDIRQRLAELQNQWSLARYDYVMAELLKLEGKLRSTLDTTGDIVELVATQQSKRLDRLVDAGAVDFSADLIDRARNNLKYALIDYQKGQYKSAHSSLNAAINDINEIQRRFDQENYFETLEEIFEDYAAAQYKFRNVLNLDPGELKALAFGTTSRGNMVAISGQSTPMDFREDVERIYSRVLLMTPPPGMEKVHESVLQAVNNGRVAALKFEKLIILNEFSEAQAIDVIDSAYAFMNTSNKMIADIQRQFFSEAVRVRMVNSTL